LQYSLRTTAALRPLLESQMRADQGRYRAGTTPLQNVLLSRQALSRLTEREQRLRAQLIQLEAQLSRWIGDSAYAAAVESLPDLPPPGPGFDYQRHPESLVARAGLDATRTEVALARQSYRPGYMLDVSYGYRQDRADMITAVVSVDLPWFRAHRQDRALAEKRDMETSATLQVEDKRRELEATYRAARAEHDALMERLDVFRTRILPDAEQATRITTAGIAVDQTQLRAARLQELETRLEYERLRVDLTKTQAELLYLTGDASL
jgi:outer membrane protein TolC